MTIKNENLINLEDKVKVAVRVQTIRNIVKINQNCIVLSQPNDTNFTNTKQFGFDYCFPSTTNSNISISSLSSNNSSSFINSLSTQEHIFQTIGIDVINNTFSGFNTCIFAYGQTGSGKSYTMMGTKEEPGLIPRLSKELFKRIKEINNNIKIEISFYEVYNERIRDLLGNSKLLKVREHSIYGPIVEGLSTFTVNTFEQIERFIAIGNNLRSTAATLMNEQSSRSHSVFSIKITQIIVAAEDKNFIGETISKISLVDLAGSERVQKTGAIGKRLEEGSNINKSLTALGKVIAALASNKNNGKVGGINNYFVPYRDSVLTWLLKENLGGNSRTTMIATISPSSEHYEETLSTLRFADRAKRIQTNAIVNEDPNAKIIRELREEVEKLKKINLTTKTKQEEAIQEAMAQIVEQHNKEKELALEKQYEQFTEYIRELLQQNNNNSSYNLSNSSSCDFGFPISDFYNIKNNKNKFLEWANKREQLFTSRLTILQQLINQANKLCFDANLLSQMFAKLNKTSNRIYYFVNLHIPLHNLKHSALNLDFKSFQTNNEEENEEINCICEPVILAAWGNQLENNNNINSSFYTQINNNNGSLQQFSIEELQLRVEEMRKAISTISLNTNFEKIEGLDNFDEFEYSFNKYSFIQEKQIFIGVANIYLGSLLYNLNSPIQLQVLIINNQGEISGKLYVQIHRTALNNNEDDEENNEIEEEEEEEIPEQLLGQTIISKVEILKATNLPFVHSNLVFCQYSFFDQPQVIIPSITNINDHNSSDIYFNSENYFESVCTQTFLNYIQEDSLSIEVWGHKTSTFDYEEENIEEKEGKKQQNNLNIIMEQKIKILKERWREVTKRLELFIEILELNDIGEYIPVDVDINKEQNNCASGGIYKLRPGQQRRLRISISTIEKEEKENLIGNLPLYLENINLILIELLLFDKRENYLIKYWLELIEERNITIEEGIPENYLNNNNGRKKEEEGYEKYCPIIFIDKEENINENNFEQFKDNNLIFGEDCLLLNENIDENNYLNLNIIEKEINKSYLSCICPWDSSLHECSEMNKISKNGEYIYIIIKIYIQISQPINACLVLRKRLCLQFISSNNLLLNNLLWPSFWPLINKIGGNSTNQKKLKNKEKRIGTGLFIDIIACIPKCLFDMEKRENLTKLAIINNLNNNNNNILINNKEKEEENEEYLNNYLKEYFLKTIQSFEWLIKIDRLRQEEIINSILNKNKKINLLKPKQKIINNNKNNIKINNNNFNYLSSSKSHNNGFITTTTTINNSLNSPNSSANSTVGQYTPPIHLTEIKEEENQLNNIPPIEEEKINFNCCENKLFCTSSKPFSFTKNINCCDILELNNNNNFKQEMNKRKQKIKREENNFLFN
ncbi:Kinesin motor domain-containing protein, partial [Meloidogyne graminicola]